MGMGDGKKDKSETAFIAIDQTAEEIKSLNNEVNSFAQKVSAQIDRWLKHYAGTDSPETRKKVLGQIGEMDLHPFLVGIILKEIGISEDQLNNDMLETKAALKQVQKLKALLISARR